MPLSQGLYYPWIDIRDEAWLKTSLLYWDSVRTIVPESIDSPYSTETARALQGAGFLVPLRVHSSMEEIRELGNDLLEHLNTIEGDELTRGGAKDLWYLIHRAKLTTIMRPPIPMWNYKFSPEVLRLLLSSRALSSDRGSDWLAVDEGFAHFYMTLLASRLAERIGASLLTSLPAAESLALAARLDAQRDGIVPRGLDEYSRRRWQEYVAFSPRWRMPRTLAPGLLAQLAIQRMAVAPDTPIDRLLKFRDQHKNELALFRTKIEQLTSTVEENISVEALRQRVSDLYANEVAPAIANLKEALDSRRIRWLSDGLLKIAFLSAGSTTMLVAAGLDVPTALLASSGLSLVVSGSIYNVDRREALRGNPYAYLLSMGKEFQKANTPHNTGHQADG